jgi:hypothetical protein
MTDPGEIIVLRRDQIDDVTAGRVVTLDPDATASLRGVLRRHDIEALLEGLHLVVLHPDDRSPRP